MLTYYDKNDKIVYESGAQNAAYTYGVGLISMTQGQDECYYNKNGHGDVAQMTNATGAVTDSYTYDAFGNQVTSTNAYNPFRYCGEYFDTETGFIYLRNRYYNPQIGRFITEDPAKDGLNWYVYCGNNPVMFVDPSGLIPTPEEAAAICEHIYVKNYNWESTAEGKESRTVEGWRLIEIWTGRESLKMGIYIREDDNWKNPSEYVVAFKGTQNWLSNEGKNNIEAALSSSSADVWDAMNYGLGFVNSVGDTEVTFVGHSKGGGEAIAAADYTNKNAITFNAANYKFKNYVSGKGMGTIINYYVEGEILESTIGTATIGTTKMLTTKYIPDIKWYDTNKKALKKWWDAAVGNHDIKTVREVL